MKLTYHNNHKEKYNSHEISIKDDDSFYNEEFNVFSHNIFDITGYGATKEEAFEDFKKKIGYLFREFRSLEKLLFETDIMENNMIEVDCMGKEIKNER